MENGIWAILGGIAALLTVGKLVIEGWERIIMPYSEKLHKALHMPDVFLCGKTPEEYIMDQKKKAEEELLTIEKINSIYKEINNGGYGLRPMLIDVIKSQKEQGHSIITLVGVVTEIKHRQKAMDMLDDKAICECDTQGLLVRANDAFYRLTGLTEKDAAGLGWVQYLHPDDKERTTELWEYALKNNDKLQNTCRFIRNKQVVTVSSIVSIIRDENRKILFIRSELTQLGNEDVGGLKAKNAGLEKVSKLEQENMFLKYEIEHKQSGGAD